MSKPQNLPEIFDSMQKYFSPKIIGEVNDVYIKLAKTKGDKVPWHIHDNEDELFYIVSGSLVMELKDEEPFTLNERELYIVPKGVEHRVHCEKECRILLVEQKDTKHTGDVDSEITKSVDQQKY